MATSYLKTTTATWGDPAALILQAGGHSLLELGGLHEAKVLVLFALLVGKHLCHLLQVDGPGWRKIGWVPGACKKLSGPATRIAPLTEWQADMVPVLMCHAASQRRNLDWARLGMLATRTEQQAGRSAREDCGLWSGAKSPNECVPG